MYVRKLVSAQGSAPSYGTRHKVKYGVFQLEVLYYELSCSSEPENWVTRTCSDFLLISSSQVLIELLDMISLYADPCVMYESWS